MTSTYPSMTMGRDRKTVDVAHRQLSVEERRQSAERPRQTGRLNLTKASGLEISSSQRRELHELDDSFLLQSPRRNDDSTPPPYLDPSVRYHDTTDDAPRLPCLDSYKTNRSDLLQDEDDEDDHVPIHPNSTSLASAAAAAAVNRQARILKNKERKERLHRVLFKIKTVEAMKQTSPTHAAATSSVTTTTSAATAAAAATTTDAAAATRLFQDDKGGDDVHEISMQSLQEHKQSSSKLLQPSMDDIHLQTSFNIIGGQLFSQNKQALKQKLSARNLHESGSDRNGIMDSATSVFSTTRPGPPQPAHLPRYSELVARRKPTKSNPSSKVISNPGTADTNSCLDVNDGDTGDTSANNSEPSISLMSLFSENLEQNEPESNDPSMSTQSSVSSDVMSNSACTDEGSSSLRRHLTPTSTTMGLNPSTADSTAGVMPEGQGDLPPVVEQHFAGDASPFTAAIRQLFQTPHPLTQPASSMDDASSSVASSFANDYLDDTSLNSANVDAVVEAAWNKRRRPTLGAIDEASVNASGVSSSGTPSLENNEEFDRDATPNPIEQKLLAQKALYDGPMGRRDSAFNESMTSASTGRRSTPSRKSVARRSSLVQPGAVRRVSLSISDTRSKDRQSIVSGALPTIDFNFGAGQVELANVRLDDTPPPETTRRGTARDRRSSSIVSNIKESATIESAALAMAAMYADGNSRRSRNRGGRLSGPHQGSVGVNTRRDARDSSVDLDAFIEFKSNGSYQSDEGFDLRSACSSVQGSMDSKKPSGTLSMYHSKNALQTEARQERNDRIWAAILHGHGVILQRSGERPVLKRMYGLGATAACITICLLLPLVILPHYQDSSGSNGQNSSFCQDPAVPNSVKRCPCNSTFQDIADPTFRDNYKTLESLLLDEGIVSTDDLDNDPESCMSKNVAIQWLAGDAWNLTSKENVSILERYVTGLVFLELGGDRWHNYAGWMTELDICYWEGLNCTRSGLATHLGLSRNNLQGVIPSEISHLTLLESINLDQNNISGVLPSSISSMSNLSEINLSGNNIRGSFPSNFSLKTHSTLRK